MIQLDFHDSRPLYEQVVEQMEVMIAQGALESDSQLPSVRQLAVELSVNPNTVQKAYGELLARGAIYSVRGKGNFVCSDGLSVRRRRLEEIRHVMQQLLEEAKRLGANREECNQLLQSLMEVGTK